MAINSLSSASYGLSGLVSGINSQEMVEKMLSGTQAKIDKTTAKKVTLQSKQQMYRDVAAKMKALQASYLSYTSGTNLLSSSFFNSMNAVVKAAAGTSAAYSVTASSSASAGNTKVDYIHQLATAHSQKTTWDASSPVKGTMNQAAAANLLAQYADTSLVANDNAVLKIKVGTDTVTFTDVAKQFGGKTGTEVANLLNAQLTAIGASAQMVNNKLVITANDATKGIVLAGSGATGAFEKHLGMSMFGDNINELSGIGSLSTTINTDLYQPGFLVNLDGRSQTIRMDLNALNEFATSGDSTAFANALSTSIAKVFGAGVKLENTAGELTLTTGAKSQTVTITGNYVAMGVLGMVSGASNKLNGNLSLSGQNFSLPLQGSRQTFVINDVEFSYNSSTSLSTIMNDINSSAAGVKIRYIDSEDRFVIETSETGKSPTGLDPIRFSQVEGNLLSCLFGAAGSGNLTTNSVAKPMTGTAIDQSILDAIENGGKFAFTVDGREYKFVVAKKTSGDPFTAQEFADEMNKLFKNSFGVKADGTQVNEFKLTATGEFQMVANSGAVIKTAEINTDTNTSLLGFLPTDSTRLGAASSIDEAGIVFGSGAGIDVTIHIGGTPQTLNISAAALNGKTMEDIATEIQTTINGALPSTGYEDARVTFDASTGGFKIVAPQTKTGTAPNFTYGPVEMGIEVISGTGGSANLDKLFGNMEMQFNTAATKDFTSAADFKIVQGQNAQMMINGSEIERASNTFSYEGVTFTLTSDTLLRDAAGNPITTIDSTDPLNPITRYSYQEASTVTVSRDTDSIVEGITEFLKLYNETVDYINGLYKADPTYKDYAPLTTKQKEEMSESEIKAWEEKSKEGLLRNDSYLATILASMRSAMYTRPDNSIALYEMGIDTGSGYLFNDGNFKIVEGKDLKAYIESNAAAVQRLFAGEGGIMELLNKSITNATNTSLSSPGILVSVAGSAAFDTTSSIYKQLKEVDEQLVKLEDRYWSEYDRYWKQFNSMEQLIQQMNTQSSWLSQQFAS